MVGEYQPWFEKIAGQNAKPHGWQQRLGESPCCENRLIRIPTGFGKTLGVLSAWLFHRVVSNNDTWPRRLIWCLPMRTLVEQTLAEAEAACERAGLLWNGQGSPQGLVGVYPLMGGMDGGQWHLWPDEYAILIGTQDMLLSRALNRGYGAGRARWPMDFGLLSQDALWVMDEVQLMDVGLITSAQLQAFRQQDEKEKTCFRPCRTWWMSATLQPGWLESPWLPELPSLRIDSSSRTGPLWEVKKPLRLEKEVAQPRMLAAAVAQRHIELGSGTQGPTLVVVNQVDRAVDVYQALRANRSLKNTDIRLVHSRFRPAERKRWREEFLCKQQCQPGTNRIVVATQVVEAGVDFSAALLFTDLAPWASLVQRVGRVARWGGQGEVVVVDTAPQNDGAAAPYTLDELEASRTALTQLADISPISLETFEESASPELVQSLYPYDPDHLLLRHEIDELFDTAPDLSGADVDVSRFIRSGEERDVSVFWAEVPEKGVPSANRHPQRDALCSVPFLRAQEWLCGKQTKTKRAPRLAKRRSAWVWDWLEGTWKEAERQDIYPGQVILVDANLGGYDWNEKTASGTGWNPTAPGPVKIVEGESTLPEDEADASQDNERLSLQAYRTIASHSIDVATLARNTSTRLVPTLQDLFELAGRWHDAGKAHPAFQGSIRADGRPDRQDLAKAPENAWPRAFLYQSLQGDRRPGLRHEMASALALFAVLKEHEPLHPALLGPWKKLLEQLGTQQQADKTASKPPTELEKRVLALDADSFNLLAYLVCCHHGKVRLSFHVSPSDQKAQAQGGPLTIRGIRTGDRLADCLQGQPCDQAWLLDLSPSTVGLNPTTGMSWTERALGLLEDYGPFALAWLEALMRAADQRASRKITKDPLLKGESLP